MKNQTNTFIKKDHYGKWEAETIIELDSTYQLSIKTKKAGSGALVTHATVGKHDGEFISHVVFQDYSKALVTSRPARVTAKTVEAQHNQIDVAEVIQEVKTFYNIE